MPGPQRCPSLGEGPPAVCRPVVPTILAGISSGVLGQPGLEATGGLKAGHTLDPGGSPHGDQLSVWLWQP